MHLTTFIFYLSVVVASGSQLSLGIATKPSPPQDTPHTRSFFFVGGSYTPDPNNSTETIYTGQLYVEKLSPVQVAPRPPPLPAILLLHGAAQTATNFLTTPDGRPGWASFFLSRGHVVYLVDQLWQGRSPPPPDAKLTRISAELIERYFTNTAAHADLWPQAKLQTQWPEGGAQGDAGFDNLYKANVPVRVNGTAQQQEMTAALVELVQHPSVVEAAAGSSSSEGGGLVVIAHSQAGFFLWGLADAVGGGKGGLRGIVALEPPGPPFEEKIMNWGPPSREWGLTDIPLQYSPPVGPMGFTEAGRERVGVETPEKSSCWQQKEPARKLVKISEIPTLVVTSESSYHAVYEHCTVAWLQQAGVETDFVKLEERGVRGNGHMFFMEKNNYESWSIVEEWVNKL